MCDSVKATLSAWGVLETLQPGEIEGLQEYLHKSLFKDNQNKTKTFNFSEFKSIWKDEAYALKDAKSKGGKIKFQMYRLCFSFNEIEEHLRRVFNGDEIYNPNSKKCYGYTFVVDHEGRVELDTLYVPMIMTAMLNLSKDKHHNIEESHNDHFEKFKYDCEAVLGNNPLDAFKLAKMDELYGQYFQKYESVNAGIFKHWVRVKYVKPQDIDSELNSFYLKDIETAKAQPNTALNQYILGNLQQKINIDENRELIENYLQPDCYPDGRWPSLVEHRLTLMQQVAVNHICKDAKTISSVNGPPGTGKTTLLKDLFAHHIVERAKTFAHLEHPKAAFTPTKIHETDQYATYFLNDVHTKFKMVVASSNNSAVENISKDLPKIAEVIRKDIESKFPQYEQEYQNVAQELEMFRNIASDLIQEDTWGLFSGVFGKKKNIDTVMKKMLVGSDSLNTILLNEASQINMTQKWKEAKQSFNDTLNTIYLLKKEIKKGQKYYNRAQKSRLKLTYYHTQLQLLNQQLHKVENSDELDTKVKDIDKYIKRVKERINDINEHEALSRGDESFMTKLTHLFGGQNHQNESKFQDQKRMLLEDKINLEHDKQVYLEKISVIREEKQSILTDIKKYESKIESHQSIIEKYEMFQSKHPGLMYGDDEFWRDTEEDYARRQESVLGTTDELQFQRGLLFLKAMVLHKYLLIGNAKSIQSGLYDFKNRFDYIEGTLSKVENAWNILHLIFPVISTTFASFNAMYAKVSKDFIDYLFIDEAGQATPQAAVGAIHRSCKVVAVGDPIQIEPVVTLERHLYDLVRKAYNVPERLVNINASVQSIADEANQYGYWKGNGHDKQWIGIPLWVHRRCLNPMFSISNHIAYENKMVLPHYVKNNEEKGKTGCVKWIDVKGKATHRQYVSEQGEHIVALLKEDWQSALNEHETSPNVFVITPFTAVKNALSSRLKNELKNEVPHSFNVSQWVDKSIGTVHTFQGKEADKVYFVTGTDDKQIGAIQWSCAKPNLINVAVTRAKKTFIIIGDKARISKLKYYDTIKYYENY